MRKSVGHDLKLKKEKERFSWFSYADFADSETNAVIVTDIHGEILLWDDSAALLFGINSREAAGKNFPDLIKLVPQQKDILKQIIEKQQRWRGLLEYSDGTDSFPETLADVNYLLEQSDTRVVFHLKADVGEEDDKKLKSSHPGLERKLFVVTDRDWNILYADPSWQVMLGWESENLFSTRLTDLFHPDDLKKVGLLRGDILSGDDIYRYPVRCRHKDGTWHLYLWQMVMDEENRLCFGNGIRIPDDTMGGGVQEKNTPEPAYRSDDEFVRLKQHLFAEHDKYYQAEEKFKKLFESSPDGSFIVDEKGHILLANHAFYEMFGYSENDLGSIHVSDLVPARFKRHDHLMGGYFREPARRGMGAGLNLYARRKDGTEISVEVALSPVSTADGTQVIVSVRDVTLQKKIEAENKRIVAALDMASEAIIMFKPGRLLIFYANQRAVDLLGYSMEELSAMDPLQLADEKMREQYRKGIERIVREKLPVKGVASRLQHKSGRLIDVEVMAHVAFLDDGEMAIVGLIRDLSESIKREEELVESEARFSTAFEYAPIGKALVGLDGRWMRVNNSMTRILGYSKEELYAIDFQRITHPDDLAKDLSLVGQLLEGRLDTYQMVKRYFHKSGKTVWALLSVALVRHPNGTPNYFISQVQDITEHRAAEEALLGSEKRFKAIFNSAFAFILLLSPEGKVLEANQTVLFFTGTETGNIMDLPLYEARWWDVEGQTDDYLRNMIEKAGSGLFVRDDVKVKGKKGASAVLDFSIKPIFNENGHVELLIAEGRDVTELRNKEEMARIFERMLASSTDGVIVLDARLDEMPVIRVNAAFEKINGYTPDEVIGNPGRLLLSNLKDQPENELLSDAFAKGIECRAELLNERKDGALFWNELYLAPVANLAGVVTHWVGVQTDITDRKNHEQELFNYRTQLEELVRARTQELELSQERLQETQQMTGLGSWELDLDTLKISWSKVANDVFGFEVDKKLVLLHDFYQIIHPDDLVSLIDIVRKLELNPGSVQYELRCFRANGELIYLSCFSRSIVKNGKPVKILSSILDITNQKQIQAELEIARNKAEMASKAKSEFLANMSHEIRTPMNAIIGFSDLLFAGINEKKQKSQIEAIRSSAGSLLRIIDDILDLSKIEAGKVTIRNTRFDLNDFLRNFEAMYNQLAVAKLLDFVVDVDKDFPPVIFIDDTRFRQIVINLVGNAIKFTEKGMIKLGIYKKYIDAEWLHLTLQVEDTGIGIPEDQLQRIFEPFTQQEGQSEKQFGGTGLGLTITKKLVETLGGTINVKSNPGTGSVFTILLPHIRYSLEQSGATENNGRHTGMKSLRFSGSFKILVADDSEVNRKLLADILEGSHLQILEASDGNEVVRMAVDNAPDIILMDLRMPGLNGCEATRLIKNNPATSHIPVICLSASANSLPDVDMAAYPVDSFIQKPINIDELILTLRKYLPVADEEDVSAGIPVKTADGAGYEAIIADDLQNSGAELREVITGNLLPLCNRACESQVIDDMESFAVELQETAQKFGLSGFNEYASRLRIFVESFEIEKLNDALGAFRRVVSDINL